jgi:carboxypeptidase family protein/two component regulator with propeller domain
VSIISQASILSLRIVFRVRRIFVLTVAATVLAGVLLFGTARLTASVQSDGATISGVIQDERGVPVSDAKVTISLNEFNASKLTQADGRFEFHNLKTGQYRITAEASRFRKESVSVVITRNDETLIQPPIKLAASSLHVAVLDGNNQPLAGVVVSLYQPSMASPIERHATDEVGDSYFGRLSPGAYQLTATLRGYDEYRNQVFISPGITTEFPLQLLAAPVIPINEKATARYVLPNLPSKNVLSLFQDTQGWMWFGTDKGVARFNGTDFRSSAGSGYEFLAGEEVRSIVEDSSGVILLATPRGVRRVSTTGFDLGTILSGRDTRALVADSRGTLWAATSSGLFRFQGSQINWPAEQLALPSNDIRALAEDGRGWLWVATAEGVVAIDGAKVIGSERWIETDAITATTRRATSRRVETATEASPSYPIKDALKEVRSIFADRTGAVWFAAKTGVYRLEGEYISRLDGLGAIRGLGFRAVSQDQTGRLWFAPESGGAVLFDPKRIENQRVGFLEHDKVAAMFSGREGSLWFATDNGAVYADFYSFVSFTTSRGLPDNNVRAIIEPPSGSDIWFFTGAGVAKLDGERFIGLEGLRANIGANAGAFDRNGGAWFATEQGAIRLSGRTLTQLNESSGLASNNVRWIAAVSGGSTIVFATTKGVTTYTEGDLRTIESLAGYDVRHVFEDETGTLWFSTSRGVVRYEPGSGETKVIDASGGLLDNDARWICRFDDKLLIATRAGIQTYEARRPTGSPLSTFDSEPTNTMFVDREGYLWAGNDQGQVKKFVLVGGHVVSAVYSGESYALTGSQINSFWEDRAGRIWIATDKGAVRHLPAKIAPTVRVTLEVDGRKIDDVGSSSYFIPYGRHRLNFRFSGVGMNGQVRYLYRINPDGADGPWEVLPVQQGAERDVTKLDLDEGAHSFELIALNRDLYGVAVPAATMSIRIGSPFWKRWWFYAAVVGLIGLALGAGIIAHRLRDREYVLPRELRTFVPIEPNPYIVGNPIRTESMFYGREDDFRYVRTKLEGVSQGVVIVFCGERRVGKSSILYQVLNGRLGDRFVPVFVDMQEMVIANDSEFFARVSRLIADGIAKANSKTAAGPVSTVIGASRVVDVARTAAAVADPGGSSIGSPSGEIASVAVPRFDGGNPYPLFLDFLDDVLAALGDRTLLLLMDEYELVESKVDEGKLSHELFTFLAGLMDNKERLALIFTGSRRLEERDKKYWRELLRRSLFRKVGFLSEKDTVRLITDPVAGRIVYGRGVIGEMCRLTAGQPFYTQVICQNIVDYLNENEQNWVTQADLKRVVDEIVDNPLPQTIYTWDALSDDEKLVLSLLTDALPDGTSFASAHELRASVRANEYPVNLSENTIRLTLEELFRRELLEKDASEGFRLRIDLLRLWIRRSHSIWQVVKEVRTL